MIKTLSVIIVISFNFFPQNFKGKSNLAETSSDIYKGAFESVSWLDVPFFSLMLLKKNLHTETRLKYFTVEPFSFDKKIQENIGTNGMSSPGSMDQNKLPTIIFLTRLAYNISSNLIDPSSVDEEDYKHGFIFYKSLIYTDVLTEISKNFIKRKRPDGGDTRSFFSGHTSISFAAASFLYLELNDFFNGWGPTDDNNFLRTTFKATSAVLLYGWAGYVGYCRMKDNKHYLSDVLLGAAVGTAVSHFLYNSYFENDETNIFNSISLGVINKSPAILLNIHF